MKSDLDLAKALARKAENDLKMARIAFEHDAPLDMVACQLFELFPVRNSVLLDRCHGLAPLDVHVGCYGGTGQNA